MANTTYKDTGFRLAGNGTSVLTDIKAYVNQHSLKRAMKLIDNNAYSDTNERVIPGLGGTTFTLNGFVNSTTDGIFGPLVNAVTSVSKRFEYNTGAGSKKYLNGNIYLSDIQYSGSLNNMQTFSVSGKFDGAVNRTSVALA